MHRSANDARYPHARHRGSYAADTISGFIQGLLDGAEFRQTAYGVDRDLSEAPLASFSEKLRRTTLIDQNRSQWPDQRDQWDGQHDNDNGER
ncbi:hypothetical protein EJC49_14765 [Aquibium carbonis]|jgi:hypothetical protein|uniref:Uncharacterized protein n=1 Tax=Aquibium carbonis TaxID=2495581 RepID=A0A3S0ARX0_9HYPH|nr:hypothetical protein EJC49_14765 [Aquibium carbonis]